MRRAAGASFCVTLLLLLCSLHEGVGAVGNGAARSHERTHERNRYDHDGTATKTVKMTRDNGNSQQTKSAVRDSSHFQERAHSGETRTVPKVHVTTAKTTATKTGERDGPYTYHERSSGNGVTVDEKKNERTVHYHQVGGSAERTHSVPKPARSHEVHKREEGNSHTRDGSKTTNRNGDDGNDTTSHSRTDSNERVHDQHSSSGTTDMRERPEPKTSSSHQSPEERTGGDEEEPAAQAKTEAHPIGLINALEGRAKQGRSIDFDSVDPREMDTTTTIIASALIGFACLILILFCVAEVAKKRREKKADSTRLLRVFQYLHEFNVDDIDIQLSAAGGFHVGYLNGLAQGINTKKQPDQKTDTSSDEGEGSGGLSKKV